LARTFAAAVVETRHGLTSRPQESQEPDFGGDDLVLWQALQHLPARQRAAIVLRYDLDLPEAEVARLLGVPAGTVKSLMPTSHPCEGTT
jgi:RNA polymerase sigma factor (sigma-70 family)